MSIWFRSFNLDELNIMSIDTVAECLGIKFTSRGDNYLEAIMLVDSRTRQPDGILNGGSSCVLAETVGSVAGNLCVNQNQYRCVGLEINANHLYPVKAGQVAARAMPIHIGKKTQVWEIKIINDRQRLICIARLTLMVLKL